MSTPNISTKTSGNQVNSSEINILTNYLQNRLYRKPEIISKSNNTVLTLSEVSGTVIDNNDQTSNITIELPKADEGYNFIFQYVVENSTESILFQANENDQIFYNDSLNDNINFDSMSYGWNIKFWCIKKDNDFIWVANSDIFIPGGLGSDYGYSMGGYDDGLYSKIDRITFPFDSGVASNVGNLSSTRYIAAGCDGTDFTTLFN